MAPQLPADFADLPELGQKLAQHNHAQAWRAKRYEMYLARAHEASYDALVDVDPLMRVLFARPATTYRDGIVALRNSVFQIARDWPHFAELFGGVPCPVACTHDEWVEHLRQYKRYTSWLKCGKLVTTILCVGDDGWVPPEFDFDEIQAAHQDFREEFIRDRDHEVSEEEAAEQWFFPERE